MNSKNTKIDENPRKISKNFKKFTNTLKAVKIWTPNSFWAPSNLLSKFYFRNSHILTYLFPILDPNEILARSTEIFFFGVRISGFFCSLRMYWGNATKIGPGMWEQFFPTQTAVQKNSGAYAPPWYALIRRERLLRPLQTLSDTV